MKKFKMRADLIYACLTNNNDSENLASESARKRTEINNYIIVSIPNFFLKSLKNSLMNNLYHQ